MSTAQLSDAQREAAEAEGPLLIVAPPGSGKTRTLIARITHLIEKRNVAPERILALTFTNKAAGEIRERLELSTANIPYCSTFHALAFDIVRTHGSLIGLPADFEVVEDEKDKSENSLTFDELLTHAVTLLQERLEARTHWQQRFDHVLVDEYQDTDDTQERLMAILIESHDRLCVIGDPYQAIYGFRGANVENFLQFASRYPQVKTIELNSNYRSTSLLVDAAAKFFGRKVRATRAEAGEKITLKECVSPTSEARWIAKQVEELMGGIDHGGRVADYQPGDIAVLYRFNAIGKTLEKIFAEAGIPSVLVTEANLDKIQFDTFRVPLMTMHAAKGLEFPVVFIAGLEDGVVPYFGFDKEEEDGRLAEEKRLLYVAMTRAKDRLFLSYSRNRKLFGKTYFEPSRFIRDIPSEYMSIEEKEIPKTFQRKLF